MLLDAGEDKAAEDRLLVEVLSALVGDPLSSSLIFPMVMRNVDYEHLADDAEAELHGPVVTAVVRAFLEALPAKIEDAESSEDVVVLPSLGDRGNLWMTVALKLKEADDLGGHFVAEEVAVKLITAVALVKDIDEAVTGEIAACGATVIVLGTVRPAKDTSGSPCQVPEQAPGFFPCRRRRTTATPTSSTTTTSAMTCTIGCPFGWCGCDCSVPAVDLQWSTAQWIRRVAEYEAVEQMWPIRVDPITWMYSLQMSMWPNAYGCSAGGIGVTNIMVGSAFAKRLACHGVVPVSRAPGRKNNGYSCAGPSVEMQPFAGQAGMVVRIRLFRGWSKPLRAPRGALRVLAPRGSVHRGGIVRAVTPFTFPARRGPLADHVRHSLADWDVQVLISPRLLRHVRKRY